MKNKYTKNFICLLHSAIENGIYTPIPTSEDYAIIDEIVGRYYPYIFNSFYNTKNRDKHIMHNPDLAHEFNLTLINLINEVVRLVFFPPTLFSMYQKNMFFEHLMKTIYNCLNKIEQQNITNREIIENIIDTIDEEFKKITNSHSYDMTEYKLSTYERIREYIALTNQYHDYLFKKIERNIQKYKTHEKYIYIIGYIAIALIIYFTEKDNPYKIISEILFIILLIEACLLPYMKKGSYENIDRELKLKLFKASEIIHNPFGIDMIRIHVAKCEISYVDPEQKNIILPICSDARLLFVWEYGFVIPNIRVMDSTNFESGYKIFIMSNEVLHLDISLSDRIVTEEKRKEYNIELNDKFIKKENDYGIFYIIDKTCCNELNPKAYMDASEYFRETFHKIIFKYVNLIFTLEETVSILQMYYKYNPKGEEIINSRLDIYDIKEIFINLLKKKCSLRRINFIMENIIKYSKTTQNSEEIAFLIYDDMIKNNFVVE